MTLTEPLHAPPPSGSPPKRPKGILKNRSSSNVSTTLPTPELEHPESPSLSERELVLANTLHNAGGPHRRSLSRGGTSRRQSGAGSAAAGEENDGSPRLKWDEANLYLAEQDREASGPRMKITEPKTPFARNYDPDMEVEIINPDGVVVDEVEAREKRREEIPDLDLGEPEVQMGDEDALDSEKRVIVEQGEDDGEEDAGVRHGEEGGYVSSEERAKHKKFAEMRKKHYEMKDIRGLLGHPEQLDYDDEDDDDGPPPPMPKAIKPNGQ